MPDPRLAVIIEAINKTEAAIDATKQNVKELGATAGRTAENTKALTTQMQTFNTSMMSLQRLVATGFIAHLGRQAVGATLDMARMAEEAAGAEQTFKRLEASTQNLRLAIGQELLPAVQDVNRGLSLWSDRLAQGLKDTREFRRAIGELEPGIVGAFFRATTGEAQKLNASIIDLQFAFDDTQASMRNSIPVAQNFVNSIFDIRQATQDVSGALARAFDPSRFGRLLDDFLMQTQDAVGEFATLIGGDVPAGFMVLPSGDIMDLESARRRQRQLEDFEAFQKDKAEQERQIILENHRFIAQYQIDRTEHERRQAEERVRIALDEARRTFAAWKQQFDQTAKAVRFLTPAFIPPPGPQQFGTPGYQWPLQDPARVKAAQDEAQRKRGYDTSYVFGPGPSPKTGNVTVEVKLDGQVVDRALGRIRNSQDRVA